MDRKTYDEITDLLRKKEEIEDYIKLIDNNPCVLYIEDTEWINMDKQLIAVVKKEFTKRLNAIDGALKELNFEV